MPANVSILRKTMWIEAHDDVSGLRDIRAASPVEIFAMIRKAELESKDVVEALLAENHRLRLKLREFGIVHIDHSAREQAKAYLNKIS